MDFETDSRCDLGIESLQILLCLLGTLFGRLMMALVGASVGVFWNPKVQNVRLEVKDTMEFRYLHGHPLSTPENLFDQKHDVSVLVSQLGDMCALHLLLVKERFPAKQCLKQELPVS